MFREDRYRVMLRGGHYFGGGGTTQSISRQEIDPDIKSRNLSLFGDATRFLNNTPFQPFPGPLVAGQQPLQAAAQSFLTNNLLGFGVPFQAPQTFGPFGPTDPFTFTQNNTLTPLGSPGNPITDSGGFTGGPTDPDSPVDDPRDGGQDIPTRDGIFSLRAQPTFGGPVITDTAGVPSTGGGTGFVGGFGGGGQTGFNFGPFGQPVGFGETGEAANVARGLTGFNPSQVQGGQFTGDRLAQLQNPFTQQVINPALADIDRATALALNRGPGSSSAGVFGGDRQAIREAEIERAGIDAKARTLGQLRSAGFNNAAGLLGTELGLGLQAGLANQRSGLAGAGLNLGAAGALSGFGGDLFNRTLGAGSALNQLGTQNRGLAQSMIDAEFDQFQRARNDPLRGFGLLQGILSGLPVGLNTTQITPTNRGAGFAGGALSGAGALAPTGNPLGIGLGALGGGLLGLF